MAAAQKIAEESARDTPGLTTKPPPTATARPVNPTTTPAHWALEVCNALLVATRHGRITIQEMSELLPDLRLLPETVDHQTDAAAWSTTLDLAKAHGLTLYDAAYLELALRRELPLATLDKRLYGAAIAAGVAIVPKMQKGS